MALSLIIRYLDEMHIFELRRIQSVAYKRPEAAIKSPDSISTF